ncbi:hypothetical protein [Sphaerisporangium sp. B11E5]|uniref:hypothetical protein n=1 Tax=Sphaerisporangium sp. B11E5 TaxID=3153563 RepID=UPI00325FAD9C
MNADRGSGPLRERYDAFAVVLWRFRGTLLECRVGHGQIENALKDEEPGLYGRRIESLAQVTNPRLYVGWLYALDLSSRKGGREVQAIDLFLTDHC